MLLIRFTACNVEATSLKLLVDVCKQILYDRHLPFRIIKKLVCSNHYLGSQVFFINKPHRIRFVEVSKLVLETVKHLCQQCLLNHFLCNVGKRVRRILFEAIHYVLAVFEPIPKRIGHVVRKRGVHFGYVFLQLLTELVIFLLKLDKFLQRSLCFANELVTVLVDNSLCKLYVNHAVAAKQVFAKVSFNPFAQVLRAL